MANELKVKVSITKMDGELLEQVVVQSCYEKTTVEELRREIVQQIERSPHMVVDPEG